MVCEYEPNTDTLNLFLELEEYDPSEVDVLSVELDLCPGITIILDETATMVDLGKVWFTTSTTKTEVTDGMLDGDFRDITRIFTEANNLSPVRSTEWTLERLYTENSELSDQTRKTTLKALQEALTSTDTATKTVTRQFIENLLHEDTRANQLTRLYIETTGGMTDELRKTPIKNLLETNTLLDDLVITKELIRILTENNNLSDGDIRQTTRVLEEVLSHADIRTNASDKTLEEQNTLADIKQFMVTRTFTEEHEMEDEEVFLARLLLLSEIMSHEDLEIETNWEIIKTYLETAQTTDAINNVLNLTKDLLEINEMLDGDIKQATRVLSEVMNTTDQVATDWNLFREFLETTEATDNVTKAFVKFLQETSEHLDVPIDREVMKVLEELAEMSDEPAVLAKLFKPKLKLLKNIDPRIRASIEQKRKIRKAGYEDPRGKGGKS